tara:strand:+ start:644 stop:1519 length:876 start_codon:yes stop_codon:yes gene_type:complete
MRKDFVAFILTYGRPNNCITVESLRKSGYTGDVVILVDDDDPSLPEYREVYGDQVHVMSKLDAAAITDTGDCAKHYRGTVYARNACFPIAKQLGYRYFVELDDDYGWFGYRYPGKRDGETEPKMHGWKILDIDAVWESLVDLLNDTGAHSVAMSQGGDHMGGTIDGYQMKLMRKAMNSWVCDVKKPFTFVGRMNDDVSTYVSGNRVGRLFFTVKPLQLNQLQSQAMPGGFTDLYLDGGTYLKSFYSVMIAPSCVKVSTIGRNNHRMHHAINWNATAPKIINESHRKVAMAK